jgi:hypothetical protein
LFYKLIDKTCFRALTMLERPWEIFSSSILIWKIIYNHININIFQHTLLNLQICQLLNLSYDINISIFLKKILISQIDYNQIKFLKNFYVSCHSVFKFFLCIIVFFFVNYSLQNHKLLSLIIQKYLLTICLYLHFKPTIFWN